MKNMRRKYIKIGLFTRMVVFICLLITFVVGINTFLSIKREGDILMKDLIERNTLFIMQLSTSVKFTFWTADWFSIEDLIKRSVVSEEVVFCRIINPNGEIYMADDRSLFGKKVDNTFSVDPQKLVIQDHFLPQINETVKLFINPVDVGEETWSVWMAISLKPINQAKMRIFYLNLLEGIIIVLIGALIASWVSRSITKPIKKLVEGTKQVSKGNLEHQIDISTYDEIGVLASAFNHMTLELKKNRDEIEEHSKTLEDKVTERTKELRHEINERKQAEEKRKQLEAQLQHAQKMEAIGNLAGGVAHDLNNTLTGLVTYPDLILMDLPENSPIRQPIMTMQKSGEKAASIVQDLLTLARRGVVIKEPANLNEVISEYLGSPEHERMQLYHQNVSVKTDLEDDLLFTSGSPMHLSKIVMNLIFNATEAMPKGGTIRISTKNQHIERSSNIDIDIKEGDYVVLTVADDGIGIPQKDIERIFEPFYTKKMMGRSGTGLGMAVVWGSVKDHDGYIDIQSAEGKGSAVSLYFPAIREEMPKGKAITPFIEDLMGRGESVLVVDDVKEQREIASALLKKLDYSAATVASGEEAIDYIRHHSVDLVLLDMIMDPGIDGYEAYKQMIQIQPGLKAVIVSGFSETDRVKEAQKLGAGAYIKKPYLLKRIGIAVKTELLRERES
jgi:two-component system cell cycle sensor histidine kinase/response regulator CckA